MALHSLISISEKQILSNISACLCVARMSMLGSAEGERILQKTDMPSFFPHKHRNCGVQQTMFRVKRLEPASKKRWPPDDLSPLQYQKIAHLPTH